VTATATATETATLTVQPTTPAPSTTTAATPTATPSEAAKSTSSSASTTPAWVWWLIGAIVLVAAVVSVLLFRRNRRKGAWADQLSSAEADVAWFARQLLPQLSQVSSVQEISGGWRVSSGRVVAAEDRLTSLESAAVDEAGRSHARTLRDAVRGARARLDGLASIDDMATAQSQLHAAAGELEAALASVNPATPGSGADNPTG
jgi:hypothetical protein